MNYRERFFNAMDQKPVDRVPVGFWHHFFQEDGSFVVGQANIDGHLKFMQETGLDFVKIMCDGYFEYPFSTKIQTAADWGRLKPLGKDSPYVSEQIERAKILCDTLQADRACLYNVFVPFTVIRHSTSSELVMAHLAEDPEAVRHGMQVVAEDTIDLIRGLMEGVGCDGLYLPLQGAEYGRFTREQYDEVVRPFDDLVFDLAQYYSDYNIAHLCAWAGDKNQLDFWRNVSTKCVNWAVSIEEMNLVEGRRFFGGKTCLGGFDNRPQGILASGTKEEIQTYTKQLIRDFGTRGLILGADCTIPATIDYERIRWVVEASEEMGA